MTWHRNKSPEHVRASALEMIKKKLREGCSPCTDAYADLARRYGATEEQIAHVLSRPSGTEHDGGD